MYSLDEKKHSGIWIKNAILHKSIAPGNLRSGKACGKYFIFIQKFKTELYNSFLHFRLLRKSLENSDFGIHFSIILDAFRYNLSMLFRYRFLDAFSEGISSIWDRNACRMDDHKREGVAQGAPTNDPKTHPRRSLDFSKIRDRVW